MTGTDQTIDAMLQQVQARLDTPITDKDELERLRKGLEGVAGRGQTLSDYKLTNADEPFSVFRVHRPEVE